MQREASRRGFVISHQKVVLDIDLAGFMRGYTEITLVPTTKNLRTISLHSRQCEVHRVSVGGKETDYILHDPLATIGPSKPDDVHSFPEIKRKLFSALAEADEGELSIAVPDDCLPFQISGSGQGNGLPDAVSRGTTPDPNAQGGGEFAPIVVIIDYSLRHPRDGIQFVLPTDAYPYRVPHAYTTPSSPDSARCWVPCIDVLWERPTWDFELVVPKSLHGRGDEDMEIDSRTSPSYDEEVPVVVVCTGDLVEKVAHPHDSKKTIFVYTQSAPTSVQQVAFAVGPFHVHSIPIDIPSRDSNLPEANPGLSPSSQTPMHAFCLPGLEKSLEVTTSFYRSAMNFFTGEYGSYPFGSHKLVFVDEMPAQRFEAATMSLVSNDLLHGEDAIDQVFDTRQSLSHALACQWVGINIIPKAWPDIWLVNGLGLYITALFLRRLFGNNEYRFRLRKDMDRVVAADVGNMPPICRPTVLDAPEAPVLAFINIKAPLVLYILDRRLGKSGTSLGLSRVLPKIFLSALSGEMANNCLSTHSFLRTCRKVSAVDVRSFADQWIYGSGCPSFTFQASFNRKKMAVELYMTQHTPAYRYNEGDPVHMALYKPVSTFEGTMTVRIHEADGTPYEHVLDIRNSQKKYEVLFNTKYKRVRRNTKRFLARKAAAAAAEAGDPEAAEALEMIDSGFELKLWEDESKRAWWMVSDWTDEDEALMNGASYEWIRLDADFEWISILHFDQPDYMWVSQLQRDRDVVAQLEALNALARQPTTIVSSNLTKTVLVTNYFFRIRAEAARMLIYCAKPSLKDIGLLHLFKLFSQYCYKPQSLSDPLRAKFVPKANDFSDFAEYFVRKSMITAIAEYRDSEGKSGHTVRRFLIDQLRYNDNSKNPFSDALYICTIIAALGRSLIPYGVPEISELSRTVWAPELDEEDRELLDLATAEIDRYREMDRLNPSSHNVISIAILEWTSIMQLSAMLPMDGRIFVAYSREGNYTPVRAAAFEALLLNKWYSRKSLARYIFAAIAHDPSRVIRRFVARGAIMSLGILEAVGDIRYTAKDGEKPVLIEEDGSVPQNLKQARKGEVELALKAIRRDAGKQKGVREIFIPTFLSSGVDHDIRWSLLKLGELLFRSDPEPPPKLSIKLATIPKPAPLVVDDVPPTSTVTLQPQPVQFVESIPEPSPLKPPKTKKPPVADVPPEPTIVAPLPEAPMDAVDVVELDPGHVHPPPPLTTPSKGSNTLSKNVTFDPKMSPPLPKKKKEKEVPKSQSGGMNGKDVQTCRNILKKLVAHKSSLVFRQPVDPVRDRAPGYFEKITSPMDLSAMTFKLDNGHYSSRSAFQSDFKLIISNARLYNQAGSYVYAEAETLDAFFDKTWQKLTATLEAMGRPKAQPTPIEPLILDPVKVELVKKMAEEPAPAVIKPIATPSPPLSTVPLAKVLLDPAKPGVPAPSTNQPALAAKPSKASTPVPHHSQPPTRPRSTSSSSKPVQPRVQTPPVVPEKMPNPPSPDPSVDDFLTSVIVAIEEEDKQKGVISPSKGKKKTKEKPVTAPPPIPTPTPRPILPDVGPSSAAPATPISARAPIVKKTSSVAKGKGREAAMLEPLPPSDLKKVKEVLKHITDLTRVPEVWLFLAPVDPVAAGCPTYYDEIKHPMDFDTLQKKLNNGKYHSMDDVAADVDLIFRNCRQFNPPGTDPVIAADAVERAFQREWARILPKRISPNDKRSLLSFITKLRETEIYFWFKDPVDTSLLPDYNTLVPKKDARDLGMIKQKLTADKYDSLEALIADFNLLARNAIRYNGTEDPVAKLATQLSDEVSAFIAQMKKKRKSIAEEPSSSKKTSNGGAPAKRAKLA